MNRYLYAYSNPTVYVDLFGYASEESNRRLRDFIQAYEFASDTQFNEYASLRGYDPAGMRLLLNIVNAPTDLSGEDVHVLQYATAELFAKFSPMVNIHFQGDIQRVLESDDITLRQDIFENLSSFITEDALLGDRVFRMTMSQMVAGVTGGGGRPIGSSKAIRTKIHRTAKKVQQRVSPKLTAADKRGNVLVRKGLEKLGFKQAANLSPRIKLNLINPKIRTNSTPRALAKEALNAEEALALELRQLQKAVRQRNLSGLGKEDIWVNPKELRYSQRTAGGGKPPRAPMLRKQMAGGWDPSKGPVDVILTKKGLVSFDNTRVAIAQEFEFEAITARIHKLTDPLPSGFAKQRGLTYQAKKSGLSKPQTWGDALRIRTKRNKLPLEGTAKRPRMPK